MTVEFGGMCPHCQGDGEYFVGSSAPDDEGFERCLYCHDGVLPTFDEYMETTRKNLEIYWELKSTIVQLEEAIENAVRN